MPSDFRNSQDSPSGNLTPLRIPLPSGEEYRLLLEGPPTTSGMRCGRVVLRPGEAAGEHTTGQHEEVLVILKGKGELWFRDLPSLPAEEGNLLYVPPHTNHDVRNMGTEILRYLYIVAPVVGGEKLI